MYLDDILIFSLDKETHIRQVRQVLQLLLDAELYVKAEKCDFHVTTVSFLSFIISEGEIKMDPAKICAVSEWPTPYSRKELQRFLGFAIFYRKFIHGFSSIAAPLHVLTSSKGRFLWSTAAQESFLILKHLFTSAPGLTLPDPHRQFILEVDASNLGVGAVLSVSCEG